MTAQEIIEKYGLKPHPMKGSYFRRMHGSRDGDSLGGPYTGDRDGTTAVYYLLTPDTYSSLHMIPGDDTLRFYAGDPVELLLLHPDERIEQIILSDDAEAAEAEFVVPGGSWQGCRLKEGGACALVGTTRSLGSLNAGYEEGSPVLIALYHQDAREDIEDLMP